MDSAAELKLPVGVTDFAQIRTGGYYYVDKTQFIEDYLYQKIRERECDMINSLLQNKEYFDMRAQRSLNKILEGQKQQADITPYVKYKEENQLLANPMWSILFLWGYLGRKRCGDFNFCNYWIVNERSKALLRECFDVWKEEQENELRT